MEYFQRHGCVQAPWLASLPTRYQADFVVLDNLSDMNVLEVYHRGKKIIKDEKVEIRPCDPQLKNTVHLLGFRESDLCLPWREGKVHILKMLEGQIVTEDVQEEVGYTEEKGRKVFKPDGTYQKIAAVERHKNTGKIGVGIVKGFGLRGSLAYSLAL